MNVLAQIKITYLAILFYLKKFGIILFLIAIYTSSFECFKYFSFKNIKHIPFSLSLLSICGLCILILSKISMYFVPSTFAFFIGFIFGIFIICVPLKYNELLALENSTYRKLFDQKYIVTKIAIIVSFITYIEIMFTSSVILACKNSIINIIYPQLSIYNQNININFIFLYFILSTIFIITYYYKNILGKILTLSILIMIISLGYFVNITSLKTNIFFNMSNNIIDNLLSLIEGITMSILSSDIFTFLSLTIYQDFNQRIKGYTNIEKKSIYSTYVITIGILSSLIFTFITVTTLPKATINMFNQVDEFINTNLLNTIIVYTYKISSIALVISIINILYREAITLLSILKCNKYFKIIISIILITIQSLLPFIFTYKEMSIIGSAVYFLIQGLLSIIFIMRKKQMNIEKQIKIT